jgi:formylglycine-generating enzyme required for sulfatase activity
MPIKTVLAGVAILAALTVTLLALAPRSRPKIEMFASQAAMANSDQDVFATTNFRPYVLNPQAEQALKPKDEFRECAPEHGEDYCPVMTVIPAGSFIMGAPKTVSDSASREEPQHMVTISKPFAVARLELTFDEWDTCVAYGDCNPDIRDFGWGRGQQPTIYVTWNEAQQYAAWLSKMTGKSYRLLTEAEYEYAARGGTQTVYPWGDEIGKNNANCRGCGSKWDFKQTAPVGSFAPNGFGLYDMVGNVFEWVEDCFHGNHPGAQTGDYHGAPTDGSAWTTGDCNYRGARGGSWFSMPIYVHSATRVTFLADLRSAVVGFRVARTLSAGAGAITAVPGVP